ncbi:MAG: response regulator [Bacteroidia bacterium]|nr:response regulator [Bacteroidia bacterium]
MKFLLIDDDEVTNFINSKIIKNVYPNADITVALNGIEALNVIEAHKQEGKASFDIVYVDISMPVMDGWMFIEKISSEQYKQQQQAYYVMLTSSVFEDDVEKAKNYAVIKLFLTKPLDPRHVNETIDLYKKG